MRECELCQLAEVVFENGHGQAPVGRMDPPHLGGWRLASSGPRARPEPLDPSAAALAKSARPALAPPALFEPPDLDEAARALRGAVFDAWNRSGRPSDGELTWRPTSRWRR